MQLEAVYRARRAISGVAIRTPLVPAPMLSAEASRDVRLKLETTQPTGAFKLRGAASALAALAEEERARGVTSASTGNHGRALAYAAKRFGVPAIICMSSLVPENKLAAIRALGAEARIVGRSQDEAQEEVDRLVAEEGMAEIPPFDHADVIAGQATIGLELMEDFPEIDTAIVPLSGGGLIAGIALALKAASPGVRIIGVSMEKGAAMHASLAAGTPVKVEEAASLADSLGGGIGLKNRFTFQMVRDLVDDIVLVPEEEIAAAMRRLFLKEGWVAEGAGAIGLALLSQPYLAGLGERVAIVVSGKNVDMARFSAIVGEA